MSIDLKIVKIAGREYISANELHIALAIAGNHRARWIEDRIARVGLLPDDDFVKVAAGAQIRSWNEIYLTPHAALRIAVSERSFRESGTTKDIRVHCGTMQEMILEMRPDLQKALRLRGTEGLTQEERIQLMGSASKWDDALNQLSRMGL